jgi:WD40 repeat protein
MTASDDKTARLWGLRAQDPTADAVVLRGHEGRITTLAISADNHWLVTSSDDKTARIWDLDGQRPGGKSGRAPGP